MTPLELAIVGKQCYPRRGIREQARVYRLMSQLWLGYLDRLGVQLERPDDVRRYLADMDAWIIKDLSCDQPKDKADGPIYV